MAGTKIQTVSFENVRFFPILSDSARFSDETGFIVEGFGGFRLSKGLGFRVYRKVGPISRGPLSNFLCQTGTKIGFEVFRV